MAVITGMLSQACIEAATTYFYLALYICSCGLEEVCELGMPPIVGCCNISFIRSTEVPEQID